MQKTFKFAVTVGRSENVALEKLAQTWAAKFGVKYVERGSRGSLGFLLDQERVEALLVATNKGPQVYTASGTFFFHPSMAVLRVQRLKKHESEITNYIKSNDPEVVRVKYDWDSVKVGDSGAFTESGFDIRLKVYGANDKELNGYSFFIVPKPNVENPISIDSISGSNFP